MEEMIPFPVLKTNLELLHRYGEDVVNDVFDQRHRIGRKNSISCLDNSNSCIENQL